MCSTESQETLFLGKGPLLFNRLHAHANMFRVRRYHGCRRNVPLLCRSAPMPLSAVRIKKLTTGCRRSATQQETMDDHPPKTRTESKRSGKRDAGPFSAKHARAAAERTTVTTVTTVATVTNPVVEWGGSKPAKAGKHRARSTK